ncbi:DMT family transporter [Brevibacillus humidisoli]|uniref:DMT family transporter n=1 Tax=Brevibacillus humidisoli TaxID=2895522 RepID=UPI001E39D05D|nr:DMT family transporter [Brevibacillus humidisoli]UFJ41957.1 DMT family transporter [Brevibacillus humidisoli]
MIGAYMQLALSMAFVGGNIAIGKMIVEEVPVFLFSEIRFLIASAILLPLLMARGEGRFKLPLSGWKEMGLQAFFGVFLFSLFMLYGVQYTTATAAGIITSTVPAFIALFSLWLLREKLTRNRMFAILFSVLGIALITFQAGGVVLDAAQMLGNLLVLLAVAAEALFTIFAKRLAGQVTPFQLAAGVNLFGLLFFLPFAVWEFVWFDLGSISAAVWGMIAFYAVTASVLSFVLWYFGVGKVPASVAGLFTGVMPISAALVSILFLGEQFHWFHGIGMILVLAAIVVGTRQNDQRASVEMS